MTAQIDDYFMINDMNLSISGISGKELFDPSSLGLKPVSSCTACWRGYQAVYAISESRLVLDKFYVGLFTDQDNYIPLDGPPINGVLPTLSKNKNDWFNNHYIGLDHQLDYTGGLLLTSGFIEELYVHMGFHPAWKYEFVYELVFSKGILKEEYDRSKQIANIRNKIQLSGMNEKSTTALSREEIQDMIDGSFDRTYRIFQ